MCLFIGDFMKKIITVFIFTFLIFISKTYSAEEEKTIIVIMDELGIEDMDNIDNLDEISLGLMNIKAKEYLKEEDVNERLKVIFYGRRIDYSKKISQESNSLAESLDENGVNIGFVGEQKRIEQLSNFKYKSYIEIDAQEKLIKKINNFFINDGDLLFIAYRDINYKDINNIIKENREKNILIFPIKAQEELRKKLNHTVVPILYSKNNEKGILTSGTTKRRGIISNLDLYPTILSIYDISEDSIGNSINIVESKDNLLFIKQELNNIIDINWIKYILHGVLIILQIIVFIIYIISKNASKISKNIGYLILSIFVISFILSPFMNILNLYTYLIILSILVYILTVKARNNVKLPIYMIIFINLYMLLSIYLNPNILYESYIGYNNILAGGRYYGLNNEGVAVLLATSIIISYKILEKIPNKSSKGLIILYLSIVAFSLSGIYGANVGGFITAIIMIYFIISSIIPKNKIIYRFSILFVIIIAIIINVFMDIHFGKGSHLSTLFIRIDKYGLNEFKKIFINKINQVKFFATTFPWSVIGVLNLLFSSLMILKNKSIILKTLFFTSLILLLINDTGIIAFMYTQSFLIIIFVKIIKFQNY